MAQLLANQAKLSLCNTLLTSNAEGAARPMEAIVSYTEMILKKIALLRDAVKQMTEAGQPMDEADLILKTETPALVHAQVNSNDAGLKLFNAADSGDSWKAKTLLFASSVQFYINYTDVDGRTPLFKAASQGYDLIVTQLITAHYRLNVDLAWTTTGTTSIYIAAQHGHASVTRQLIEAHCNVDLALTTNGAKPLHVAAVEGHTDVIKQLLLLSKMGHTPLHSVVG
jgi:hypothetical protein